MLSVLKTENVRFDGADLFRILERVTRGGEPRRTARLAVSHRDEAGDERLVESLRLELQPDIRVIVIEPGAVATELTSHITHADSKRAAQEATANTHIAPNDIAEVIAFAISRPKHVALNEILVRPPRKRSDEARALRHAPLA